MIFLFKNYSILRITLVTFLASVVIAYILFMFFLSKNFINGFKIYAITTLPRAGLTGAGREVMARIASACVGVLMESTSSMPDASEVAVARFTTRPATFLAMGSSPVMASLMVSSTFAARANPMPPWGCGPFACLPFKTPWTPSNACVMSGPASKQKARIPRVVWGLHEPQTYWKPSSLPSREKTRKEKG